jgi:hypothetical protein
MVLANETIVNTQGKFKPTMVEIGLEDINVAMAVSVICVANCFPWPVGKDRNLPINMGTIRDSFVSNQTSNTEIGGYWAHPRHEMLWELRSLTLKPDFKIVSLHFGTGVDGLCPSDIKDVAYHYSGNHAQDMAPYLNSQRQLTGFVSPDVLHCRAHSGGWYSHYLSVVGSVMVQIQGPKGVDPFIYN